jgi:hypothetical protein
MKTGDKIKAFVQVGLMKSPRWLKGTLVEPGKVDVNGNVLSLEPGKIKLFRALEKGAAEKFAEENWDNFKEVLSAAKEKFFPLESLRFDDEEKVAYLAEDISIAVSVNEAHSIARITEYPTWAVCVLHKIPATRWEPEDADEAEVGDSPNNVTAAKIAIDTLWRYSTMGYWESLEMEV